MSRFGRDGGGDRRRLRAVEAGDSDEVAEVGPEEHPEVASAEELREFLAADTEPVRADPVFKEALRRELWRLVRRRIGRGWHLDGR